MSENQFSRSIAGPCGNADMSMNDAPLELDVSNRIPTERRRQARYVSVLRVARLTGAGSEQLCLIRNISSNGLMARVYRPFEGDEIVQIELRSGRVIDGRVVWNKEGNVGISFVGPIRVEEELARECGKLADESREGRARLPRIRIDGPVSVRRGNQEVGGRVKDISQQGARIMLDRADVIGVDDSISLNFVPECNFSFAAQVRWRRQLSIGLQFKKTLTLETVAEIAQILQKQK